MQPNSALNPHFSLTDSAFFEFRNGTKAPLPFPDAEYQERVTRLRQLMDDAGLAAVVFTSMHNVAYYSGFLYCAFGRPYACVVTSAHCIVISANIDGGQPWRRSIGENLVYTDWTQDNFWLALRSVLPAMGRIGFEGDHLTSRQLARARAMRETLGWEDVAEPIMRQRLVKSAREIELIGQAARIADEGGEAAVQAIRPGVREIDVAMAARDAMEVAIAARFPGSELRDTWVWFQSGLNTDGAHNPVTTRSLCEGDILSLNTFPMVSGYYAALERTLFLGEPDPASLRIWEANVGAHELGLSLIRPGITCSAICAALNEFFSERGLLRYRSFGYGHSFGVLSHYYGREAGLELREDVDTVLEPGMVVSMEPMLRVPEDEPGAGGYREHDILVVTESGARNLTGFPFGPRFNVIGAR